MQHDGMNMRKYMNLLEGDSEQNTKKQPKTTANKKQLKESVRGPLKEHNNFADFRQNFIERSREKDMDALLKEVWQLIKRK